jgi:hypothetical protein
MLGLKGSTADILNVLSFSAAYSVQPLVCAILIANLIKSHISKRWEPARINRAFDGLIIGIAFPIIQLLEFYVVGVIDFSSFIDNYKIYIAAAFLVNACAGFVIGAYVPVTVAVNLIRMRSSQGPFGLPD